MAHKHFQRSLSTKLLSTPDRKWGKLEQIHHRKKDSSIFPDNSYNDHQFIGNLCKNLLSQKGNSFTHTCHKWIVGGRFSSSGPAAGTLCIR